MKKTMRLLIVLFLALGLAHGCEKKPPPVVPEEVDAEIAAAKATYDKLMKLNPPSTITFHYRSYMKEAEDARDAGKYEKAIEAARKAKEQAELAIDARLQALDEMKKELGAIKKELESMYLPPMIIIESFWDAVDAVKAYDYEKAKALTEDIRFKINQEKKMSYAAKKYLTVTAPEEYIRRWGNVRIYKEITKDGKLREVVATSPPNTDVLYVRMELLARGRTFYLVEIPGTGLQGWMAEQYVAPERMLRR